MRIYVKVIAGSSRSKIEKLSTGDYKIWVSAPPEKGRANKQVIKLLADYFSVSKQRIKIVAGKTVARKIIDISPIQEFKAPFLKKY